MKTSAIHVHDMLSVFSVDEVEKRIREVPGVESATVNFAAGSATVRYDETQLEASDIKSAVRQRGLDVATPGGAMPDEGHVGPTTPSASSETPKSPAAPTAPEVPAADGAAEAAPPDKAGPSAAPDSAAAAVGEDQQDKAEAEKS